MTESSENLPHWESEEAPQSSSDPISLGYARHRQKRESFDPLPPGEVSETLTPVDRTKVDEFIRRFGIPESQSGVMDSESVQESMVVENTSRPQSPLEEKHTRRKFLALLGLGGAAAVGGGAVYKLSKDQEKKQAVVPGATPGQGSSLEPTPTPRVESTPIPEKPKYPYEIGFEHEFGNTIIAVSKDMQERKECPPPNGHTETNCPQMHSVILNTESKITLPDGTVLGEPELISYLNEGILFGYYRAWQARGDRSDVSFGEYKEKVDRGEDMSFTIQNAGMKEASFLPASEIVFDPRRKTKIVFLGKPAGMVNLAGALRIGYREMDNTNYIELYDFFGGGVGNTDYTQANPSENLVAIEIEDALAVLGDLETLEAGRFTPNISTVLMPKIRELDQFFIPEKTDDVWKGIIKAQ